MENIKNLKTFKGNKRGAPWILKPVDHNTYSVVDIPKLKPDEVNVVELIRADELYDQKTGKRNYPKPVVLCKVSELPDDYKNDEQRKFIWQKMKDIESKRISFSESNRTGAETSVSDMLNKYLLSPKVRKEKNHFGKVKHLSFFKDEIGHLVLMDVKPRDIRIAKDKLLLPNPNAKRGDCLSGKTINNYVRSLRTAFEWATKYYDNFEYNPVYYVESEEQETFEHRELTDAERATLFGMIKLRTNPDLEGNTSKELHDFVTWGIWVGSRKGETLALEWDNIDFKKEEITFTHALRKYECKDGEIKDGKLEFTYNRNVRTKGLKASVKQRSTSFEELPQIRKLLRRRWSERSGNRIFSQDCRSAWESCLKASGIENFRYHDLRKTCGTYLYQNDVSLEDIAYYLGHKGTSTTEKDYVRKNNDVSRKLGKILQKKMG